MMRAFDAPGDLSPGAFHQPRIKEDAVNAFEAPALIIAIFTVSIVMSAVLGNI